MTSTSTEPQGCNADGIDIDGNAGAGDVGVDDDDADDDLDGVKQEGDGSNGGDEACFVLGPLCIAEDECGNDEAVCTLSIEGVYTLSVEGVCTLSVEGPETNAEKTIPIILVCRQSYMKH